ncbi:DNA-binding transcriptional regulator, LysR family [Phyllobacterium sp. YR620]|uniref:LysR family transcriptional regulator n=1 Tax=Phyllobacterium pellucidum TaxID=2740464 RepID=A0A849VVD5_9HYPH|nr:MULTISPECIES: LysR family transcriptional regulator [Phyllobacterium]NTS33696.1 LysR family transcriptional regulator [Phyllobacterium pellucidum]SDO87876.1 DNA-binding transcriptional regulator, LysR family [Phyllobacterium sp. YR620]
MNPRQLKTFLTVARLGNLTRAAKESNLAQSSLSDQMQALEAELGVQLFERSRLGVILTSSGEVLRAYAEEIMALNDEAKAAIRAAAQLQESALRIGTLETIAAEKLAVFLSRFRHVNPNIDLTLKIGGSGELQRQLEEGSIDMAITFDRGLRDERFVKRLLSREPLALIAGGNSKAAAPEKLEDLIHLPFIATETGCVYRHLFDRAFADAGIAAPRIATQADSIATIMKLVASGAGYGVVPRLALGTDAKQGNIRIMPWPGATPTTSLIMAWRRRRIQPAALSLLLAAASQDLGSLRSVDVRPRHAV